MSFLILSCLLIAHIGLASDLPRPIQTDPNVVLGDSIHDILKMQTRIKIVKTQYDDIFVGNVSIGGMTDREAATGRKNYKMMFDTSMSDTLVLGKHMDVQRRKSDMRRERICDYQPRDPTFYNARSSTKKPPQNNDEITEYIPLMVENHDGSEYTLESVEKDTLKIGSLVLKDINFGVVESMNSAAICLRGSDYDGIIGLNFEALKRSSPPTQSATGVFPYMLKKNMLSKPVFSVYMHPAEGSTTGEVIFGGIDYRLFIAGSLQYFPITRGKGGTLAPDWRLTFDSMRLGDSKQILGEFAARFESTYRYGIYSPNAKVISTEIINSSPWAERLESGAVVIECDRRNRLPDLVLTIGGKEISFTAREYFPFRIQRRAKGGPGLCELFVFDNSNVRNPDGLFALGIPFMKKYYTVFDAEEARIGIARSTDDENYCCVFCCC